MRGHVTPGTRARNVLPDHAGIVCRTVEGRRLARCLRCDAWVNAPESDATLDLLPRLEDLELPRRGRPLRDALVLRLISVERAIHAVAFTLAALALWFLEADLPGLQTAATNLTKSATSSLAGPGQSASRDVISRELVRLTHLHQHSLAVLAVTATVYAVVEGTEAVGLWFERRWAEYLTALATAGFLPFEVRELIRRVTVIRAGALFINLAVLAWLVWRKHLFGIGRTARQETPDPLAPFRGVPLTD